MLAAGESDTDKGRGEGLSDRGEPHSCRSGRAHSISNSSWKNILDD